MPSSASPRLISRQAMRVGSDEKYVFEEDPDDRQDVEGAEQYHETH
jgi:hypothetical protein